VQPITDCIQGSRESRGGANLLLPEFGGRKLNRNASTFEQGELPFLPTGSNDLAFVGDVYVEVGNLACGAPALWVARSHHSNVFKQPHSLVHRKAEVGDVRSVDLAEKRKGVSIHIVRELANRLLAPLSHDPL